MVDLAEAAPQLPREMTALLEAPGPTRSTGCDGRPPGTRTRIPIDDVHLEAPILRPPKILAVGLNYADHVAESGR